MKDIQNHLDQLAIQSEQIERERRDLQSTKTSLTKTKTLRDEVDIIITKRLPIISVVVDSLTKCFDHETSQRLIKQLHDLQTDANKYQKLLNTIYTNTLDVLRLYEDLLTDVSELQSKLLNQRRRLDSCSKLYGNDLEEKQEICLELQNIKIQLDGLHKLLENTRAQAQKLGNSVGAYDVLWHQVNPLLADCVKMMKLIEEKESLAQQSVSFHQQFQEQWRQCKNQMDSVNDKYSLLCARKSTTTTSTPSTTTTATSNNNPNNEMINMEIIDKQLREIRAISEIREELREMLQSLANVYESCQSTSGNRGKKILNEQMEQLRRGLYSLEQLDEIREEVEEQRRQMQQYQSSLSEAMEWSRHARQQYQALAELPDTLPDKERLLQRITKLCAEVSQRRGEWSHFLLHSRPTNSNDSEDLQQNIEQLAKNCSDLRSTASVNVELHHSFITKLNQFESSIQNLREAVINSGNTISLSSSLSSSSATTSANSISSLFSLRDLTDHLAATQKLSIDIGFIERDFRQLRELAERVKVGTGNRGKQLIDNQLTSMQDHLQELINRNAAQVKLTSTQCDLVQGLLDELNATSKQVQEFEDFSLAKEGKLGSSLREKEQLQEAFHEILSQEPIISAQIQLLTNKMRDPILSSSSGQLEEALTSVQKRFFTSLDSIRRSEAIAERARKHHTDWSHLCTDFYELKDKLERGLHRKELSLPTSLDMLKKLREILTEAQVCSQRVISDTSIDGQQEIEAELQRMSLAHQQFRQQIERRKRHDVDSERRQVKINKQLETWNQTMKNLEETINNVMDDLTSAHDLNKCYTNLEILQRNNLEVLGLHRDLDNVRQEIEKDCEEDPVFASLCSQMNNLDSRCITLEQSISDGTQHYRERISLLEAYRGLLDEVNTSLSTYSASMKHLNHLPPHVQSLMEKRQRIDDLLREIRGPFAERLESLHHLADRLSNRDIDGVNIRCQQIEEELKIMLDNCDKLTNQVRLFEDDLSGFMEWLHSAADKWQSCQGNGLLNDQTEESLITKFVSEIEDKTEIMNQLHLTAEDVSKKTLDPRLNMRAAKLKQEFDKLYMSIRNERENCVSKGNQMRDYNKNYEVMRIWLDECAEKLAQCDAPIRDHAQLLRNVAICNNLKSKMSEGLTLLERTVKIGEQLVRGSPTRNTSKIAKQVEELKSDWNRNKGRLRHLNDHLDQCVTLWNSLDRMLTRMEVWLKGAEEDLLTISDDSDDIIGCQKKMDRFDALEQETAIMRSDFAKIQDATSKLNSHCQIGPLSEISTSLGERFHILVNKIAIGKASAQEILIDFENFRAQIHECDKWIVDMNLRIVAFTNLARTSSGSGAAAAGGGSQDNRVDGLLNEALQYENVVEEAMNRGRNLITRDKLGNAGSIHEINTQMGRLDENYRKLIATLRDIQSRHKESQMKLMEKKSNEIKEIRYFLDTELPQWWTNKQPCSGKSVEDIIQQSNDTQSMLQRCLKHQQKIAMNLSLPQQTSTTSMTESIDTFPEELGLRVLYEETDCDLVEARNKLEKRIQQLFDLKKKFEKYCEDRQIMKDWVNKCIQEVDDLVDRRVLSLDSYTADCYLPILENIRKNLAMKKDDVEQLTVDFTNLTGELASKDPKLMYIKNDFQNTENRVERRIDELEMAQRISKRQSHSHESSRRTTPRSSSSRGGGGSHAGNDETIEARTRRKDLRNSGGRHGLSKNLWPYMEAERDLHNKSGQLSKNSKESLSTPKNEKTDDEAQSNTGDEGKSKTHRRRMSNVSCASEEDPVESLRRRLKNLEKEDFSSQSRHHHPRSPTPKSTRDAAVQQNKLKLDGVRSPPPPPPPPIPARRRSPQKSLAYHRLIDSVRDINDDLEENQRRQQEKEDLLRRSLSSSISHRSPTRNNIPTQLIKSPPPPSFIPPPPSQLSTGLLPSSSSSPSRRRPLSQQGKPIGESVRRSGPLMTTRQQQPSKLNVSESMQSAPSITTNRNELPIVTSSYNNSIQTEENYIPISSHWRDPVFTEALISHVMSQNQPPPPPPPAPANQGNDIVVHDFVRDYSPIHRTRSKSKKKKSQPSSTG